MDRSAGSIFGFFSYLADYLDVVTGLNTRVINLVLLIYGAENIAGNIIAGRILTNNAEKTFVVVPLLLFASFGLMFAVGHVSFAPSTVVLVLGILAGILSKLKNRCGIL